jgi:hypothetical protein
MQQQPVEGVLPRGTFLDRVCTEAHHRLQQLAEEDASSSSSTTAELPAPFPAAPSWTHRDLVSALRRLGQAYEHEHHQFHGLLRPLLQQALRDLQRQEDKDLRRLYARSATAVLQPCTPRLVGEMEGVRRAISQLQAPLLQAASQVHQLQVADAP